MVKQKLKVFVIVVVTLSGCCDVFRFDGWVVCEEHRESLTYAWEEEQAILQQKELDVGFLIFITYLVTVISKKSNV